MAYNYALGGMMDQNQFRLNPEQKIPEQDLSIPMAEEEKKKNSLKTILPLVLRFLLPAAAGGVIGAKTPVGGLGGALGGLASAGAGYGAGELALDKEAAELGREKAKFEREKPFKEREVAASESRAESSRLKALTGGKGSGSNLTPQQKVFETVAQNLGGQMADDETLKKEMAAARNISFSSYRDTDFEADKQAFSNYLTNVYGGRKPVSTTMPKRKPSYTIEQ